jgi:hypothetical protein
VNSEIEKLSYAVDILLFQFFASTDLCKLTKRRNKGISYVMDFKMPTDSDSMHESL